MSATGALFSCVQNRGIFDGPTDAAYMAGMASWHIDIVRVPMNEDCWLGINNVPAKYSGAVYQAALKAYVDALVAYGFNVILELHWTAPGTQLATGQMPMPDHDHALDFWRGVAGAFGQRQEIVFDVFNEPFPDNNAVDSTAAWQCWKHGTHGNLHGASVVPPAPQQPQQRQGGLVGGDDAHAATTYCHSMPFHAVGMDEIVETIRAANATNVLMLGGVHYSNTLSQWVQYMPGTDPLHRLAASWHSYSTNTCNNEFCWALEIAPVMQHVPVITGELGENDCKGTYISKLMAWLDGATPTGATYLAWLWANWNCETGPSLITNYDGSCTDSYGCTYQAHLASRHKRSHLGRPNN